MVSVAAKTEPARPVNAGTMSFFSGGVDSTYSFLKRIKEISHVVCIHGFDFYFNQGGGSTFSAADLKDLSQFASKLVAPLDAVSAFLKATLSSETLETLVSYLNTGLDPGRAEAALVNELNRIVAGAFIYDPQRFAGVKLRPDTRQLLKESPPADEPGKVNRYLLEDAYPREIAGKNSGAYQIALDRNTRFVREFGKTLIPVETNFYPFGYRYNLSRNLSQGGCLGSIALLLGFSNVYVPASYSYNELFPLGSHPLPDPLWSNECVHVVHDGCEAGRTEKLKLICQCDSALANLRVCFDDANHNCGRCLKCLRTMISLKLLHAHTGCFPPLPALEAIGASRISGEVEMAFLKENADLAQQSEAHDLRDALCACIRRHERRRLFREVDRVLLSGFIKRACRRIAPPTPGWARIDTTPRRS